MSKIGSHERKELSDKKVHEFIPTICADCAYQLVTAVELRGGFLGAIVRKVFLCEAYPTDDKYFRIDPLNGHRVVREKEWKGNDTYDQYDGKEQKPILDYQYCEDINLDGNCPFFKVRKIEVNKPKSISIPEYKSMGIQTFAQQEAMQESMNKMFQSGIDNMIKETRTSRFKRMVIKLKVFIGRLKLTFKKYLNN